MRRVPRKSNGQAQGPRRINGVMMDVYCAAGFLGVTQKMLRARVTRGTLPFRRLGCRIIFIKSELEHFLEQLDGVTASEALDNARSRAGASK